MKNVFIKYNPYKLKTEITIDGKPPKDNSALNVEGKRLQEWVEDLPKILREEENDNRFDLTFHGTIPDHEDMLSVINNSKDVKFEYKHIKPKEIIAEKIDLIGKIFEKITNGPFKELNDDEEMKDAFDLAMKDDFEVNVVATMSAGKSTLINALLGRKLMPSKQEACTAVITEIKDKDSKNYSAKVYDKDHTEIESHNNLTLETMNRLNSNPAVSTIEIEGDIPFVSSSDGSLVLVDTPGPNNSRDPAHYETTHGMLAKSSKTLVLYILNAGQLGINDDSSLINTVAKSMTVGGKQSKDRFIFVVNKLDDYRKGEDSIENALKKTRQYLEDKGIENPNIYPAAALPALDIIRFLSGDPGLSEDDKDEMEVKAKKFNRNEEFHFEGKKYVTLPSSIRGEIEASLEEAKSSGDKYREALIHTGIVPLQKAIELYVNKYARTAKITNVVATFEKKLEGEKAFEKLKGKIASNKDEQEKIKLQIEEIKRKRADGENARKYRDEISRVDMYPPVHKLHREKNQEAVKKMTDAIEEVMGEKMTKTIEEVMGEKMTKTIEEVSKRMLSMDEVNCYCRRFEGITRDIEAEFKEGLGDNITEMVNKTTEELIAIYKEKLASLSAEHQIGGITIDPLQLISGQFNGVENPELLYEKYKEKYKVKTGTTHKEKNPERRGFLGFFKIFKPWTIDVFDYEKKEGVNRSTFAQSYFAHFLEHIQKLGEETEKYSKNVTEFIKESFEEKFSELDLILDKKLEELEACTGDAKNLETVLAETEGKLRWLEDIQSRLRDILEI